MREAPCKDCKERHKLLAEGIHCHSYCKSYQEFKEARKAVSNKRIEELEIRGIQNEGYKRTTRGQYENYNRRWYR